MCSTSESKVLSLREFENISICTIEQHEVLHICFG